MSNYTKLAKILGKGRTIAQPERGIGKGIKVLDEGPRVTGKVQDVVDTEAKALDLAKEAQKASGAVGFGSRIQDPEALKAAISGAGEGLTLGQSEKLGGGVQAGLEKLHELAYEHGVTDTVPQTLVNRQLAELGVKGYVGPTDVGQVYELGKEQQQKGEEKLEKTYPEAYLVGELAGTGLLTGGAIGTGAKVLKAASTGKKASRFAELLDLLRD